MQKSNQFIKTLNHLDKRVKRAEKQLADIRIFYETGHLDYACDVAFELEENMEKAALLTRALPAYTGVPSALDKVEEIILNTVPIEIGYTEQGWFLLRLPFILPKKESGSVDYIRGYLYPAMRKFFNGKIPVRYGKCVIAYRHVYDRQRPERRYRDHDNIEINYVTDTVALFVMEDDSPLMCSHYYCSAPGTHERTEVYVVPDEEFMQWVRAEENIPDKGVLIFENNPKTS